MSRGIRIGGIIVGGGAPLVLIAGPCVIEGEEFTLTVAKGLQEICRNLPIPLIFKASYDKANRTSISSNRGPGLVEGLRILQQVKKEVGLPILSDVHSVSEVPRAAEVLDVIQIPAFLCRQTDLLVEAGRTGRPINVKKGQFLAPWDMAHVVEKITSTGNEQILLTERGTSFGYNNLVSDIKALPIMRGLGYPVIYDATHSVQLPGGAGKASGGNKEFIPHLARAAVGAGVDGVFLEVHPNPEQALSDGANSLKLDALFPLLKQLRAIDRIAKEDGG
ncbi:MAG: 3-deoxy-8-phosphooctulonate synthase [Deltaproteobacteria bacterium RBG_13_52_11]|nr:MAG: 3-deoxy-8-phosphooctulonate synthase [Deltaproteobacteria bacterium RBG_13_52_11]